MKSNRIYIASLMVVLLLLSGCGKETKVKDREKSFVELHLKVAKPAKSQGRAVGESIGDDLVIPLVGGDLYVTQYSGWILKRYTLTAAQSDPENGIINLDDFLSDAGVTLTNIPSTAFKLYFIGNRGEDGDEDGQWSGIFNVINVKRTLSSALELKSTSLYGESQFLRKELDYYTTTLNIGAVTSRLEIADITFDEGLESSYKLDGIFLDNYYALSDLCGTGRDFQPATNEPLMYLMGEQHERYTPQMQGVIFEYDKGNGIGGSGAVKVPSTEAGKYWVYNIFSGETLSTVVLRFSKIEDDSTEEPEVVGQTEGGEEGEGEGDDEPEATVWFVTLAGFQRDDSGLKIYKFDNGHIYRIESGAIVINEEMLDPIPNNSKISNIPVSVSKVIWTPPTK